MSLKPARLLRHTGADPQTHRHTDTQIRTDTHTKTERQINLYFRTQMIAMNSVNELASIVVCWQQFKLNLTSHKCFDVKNLNRLYCG